MTEVCSVADPDPAGSVSFFWIWIRIKNRAESLSYSANCDPWSLKSNKNFCKTILQKLIMADFKWIVSRDLRSPQLFLPNQPDMDPLAGPIMRWLNNFLHIMILVYRL